MGITLIEILYNVFTLHNLLFCFAGVFLGTLVGVIPGFGPLPAIALLLPISVSLGDTLTGLVFLSGIYYGTQYGGSTTSILLKLPGESSSAVISADGYALTSQGKGMTALAVAAVGSFIGGTIGVIFLSQLSIPLSKLTLLFGPAEYTTVLILALLLSLNLSKQNKLIGLLLLAVGLCLGYVGTQISSGVQRFTFGFPELADGISFVVLTCSLFGLSEIIYQYFEKHKIKNHSHNDKIDWRQVFNSWPSFIRGTTIGSVLGGLPGIGVITSSFLSYSIEKKLSTEKEQFGKGSIKAIAGPESANNAAAQTAFIPALSMGVPATPVMALILSYLIMMGIQPGPQFISNNQSLFWSLICSMWLGNLFLLILNLPLIKIWITFLSIPKNLLNLIVVSACLFGTFIVGNGWFDLILLIPFTVFGLILKYFELDPTPILFGFIFGPMIEEHLERTLMISQGNWMIFFDKPICLSLIICALIFSTLWIWLTRRIST